MINLILKPDTNQQWNNEFNIFPCLPKYIIFFLWQINIYLTVLLWIISTYFKFDSNNLWKCNKITWRKKLFLGYSVWKNFIFIWKQNLRWSFWFKRFIWRRREAKQGRGRKNQWHGLSLVWVLQKLFAQMHQLHYSCYLPEAREGPKSGGAGKEIASQQLWVVMSLYFHQW